MFRSLAIFLLLILGACSPRGQLGYSAPQPGAQIVPVFAVVARDDKSGLNAFGDPRPDTVRLQRLQVSTPPDHVTGQIEWPRGTPDPKHDFAVVGQEDFQGPRLFAGAVARADTARLKETVVFVHGYNTTHGEAVYRLAQISRDLDIPAPVVLFSWQSAADARGYLYDRDSVIYARDDLETLLRTLTSGPDRRVFVVGHSMGSYLIMEALRQISIKGDTDVLRKISGVAFLAPDIDPDIFRRQAARIRPLPDPFVIFVAQRDRILGLSALITGRQNRLGTITDPADLDGLPIQLIDLTGFAVEGVLNHNIAISSPAALAFLRNMTRLAVRARGGAAPVAAN